MMAAVVKADGYGHGAEAVSEVLEPLPYLWAMPLLQATRQCSLSQQAEKSRYLF